MFTPSSCFIKYCAKGIVFPQRKAPFLYSRRVSLREYCGLFKLHFTHIACILHSSIWLPKISAPATGFFSLLCSLKLWSTKPLSKVFYPTPSTPTELPGSLVPHCSAMEIQLLLSSGSNQLNSKCRFQSFILSSHYSPFSYTFNFPIIGTVILCKTEWEEPSSLQDMKRIALNTRGKWSKNHVCHCCTAEFTFFHVKVMIHLSYLRNRDFQGANPLCCLRGWIALGRCLLLCVGPKGSLGRAAPIEIANYWRPNWGRWIPFYLCLICGLLPKGAARESKAKRINTNGINFSSCLPEFWENKIRWTCY